MSARTEHLLRTLVSIVSAVDDYLFAWHFDHSGACTVLFESRPFAAFVGTDATDPLEALHRAVIAEDHKRMNDWIAGALVSPADIRETFRAKLADGYIHRINVHGACSPDTGGVVIEGIIKDAGSSEREQDELLEALTDAQNLQIQNELLIGEAEERSRTDALTNAYNRRYFMERATYDVGRVGEELEGLGLMILDIDRFKSINDTYGHPAGDAVLIEVARRLASRIRECDVVARFGGEEFAVLIAGVTEDEQLERLGERVRCAISEAPIALPDGLELPVTASAGAARCAFGRTVEQLLAEADLGLYAAKRGGRNQIRMFSSLSDAELEADEPETITLARGLALAASVREASPERHCEEVADLAAAIALHLGLGEAVAMRCRLGGWLHDVGKLGVPDRVLQGRSATVEDRNLLRSHVELGADIVSRMSALKGAEPAVRHHHERWDGSGYPDSLAGEVIPIDARIVAVADAYSALTAGRPYQAPLEHAAACEELRRTSGTHFDPTMVEALIAVLGSGEAALRDAA